MKIVSDSNFQTQHDQWYWNEIEQLQDNIYAYWRIQNDLETDTVSEVSEPPGDPSRLPSVESP